MRVIADTSAVRALLNQRDDYHREAGLCYRDLIHRRCLLFMPRLVFVEVVTWIIRDKIFRIEKQARKSALSDWLDRIAKLEMQLVEHIDKDHAQAKFWCCEYADWPLGFIDATIVATTLRFHANAIWTFDEKDMAPFVRHAISNVEISGFPTGKYGIR